MYNNLVKNKIMGMLDHLEENKKKEVADQSADSKATIITRRIDQLEMFPDKEIKIESVVNDYVRFLEDEGKKLLFIEKQIQLNLTPEAIEVLTQQREEIIVSVENIRDAILDSPYKNEIIVRIKPKLIESIQASYLILNEKSKFSDDQIVRYLEIRYFESNKNIKYIIKKLLPGILSHDIQVAAHKRTGILDPNYATATV